MERSDNAPSREEQDRHLLLAGPAFCILGNTIDRQRRKDTSGACPRSLDATFSALRQPRLGNCPLMELLAKLAPLIARMIYL